MFSSLRVSVTPPRPAVPLAAHVIGACLLIALMLPLAFLTGRHKPEIVLRLPPDYSVLVRSIFRLPSLISSSAAPTKLALLNSVLNETANANSNAIAPYALATSSASSVASSTAPSSPGVPLVTSAEFAAWSKVNVCEEGGDWHYEGAEFSGGLGISNANWVAYGGTQFAPDAAEATPAEQIVVAARIQPDPPDQYGCTGGW